jgi:hypothetical protein
VPPIPTVIEAPPDTHWLPAVAIARLAAIADAQAALAETITVRPKERVATVRGKDGAMTTVPVNDIGDFESFNCSARLLQKSARGIAALVLAERPALAGDISADVAARLVKLGVPTETADAIVDQLTARRVLTTVAQSPDQQHEHIARLLVANGYKDGKL